MGMLKKHEKEDLEKKAKKFSEDISKWSKKLEKGEIDLGEERGLDQNLVGLIRSEISCPIC